MSFNMDDYKPEKKAPEYNFVIPARKKIITQMRYPT